MQKKQSIKSGETDLIAQKMCNTLFCVQLPRAHSPLCVVNFEGRWCCQAKTESDYKQGIYQFCRDTIETPWSLTWLYQNSTCERDSPGIFDDAIHCNGHTHTL